MSTNRLTTTSRQKRKLTIPSPGRKGNIKVTPAGWLNAAKVVLIEEGIGAVKVDRLARRLKMTRGSFYHYFKSHYNLLELLLKDWQQTNRFVPASLDASTISSTLQSFHELTNNLVYETGFDPQYDMAMREWARISKPVSAVVHTVDEIRIEGLRRLFVGFGYKPKEALIRARIMYWHQIGYYSIGVEESVADRESNLEVYLQVLGGEKYLSALHSCR